MPPCVLRVSVVNKVLEVFLSGLPQPVERLY